MHTTFLNLKSTIIIMGKKSLFLVVSVLAVFMIFSSCKKSKKDYLLSYDMSGDVNLSWSSDKPAALIKNDTLLMSAKLNDKTAASIICISSQPGTYDFIGNLTDVESGKAFLTVAPFSDNTKSTFLSIGGTLTILSKDTDAKELNGVFTAKAFNLLTQDSVNVDGTFKTEYKDL